MGVFVVRDTVNNVLPSGLLIHDGFQKLGWECFYVPSEDPHSINDYDFGKQVDIFFDYQNPYRKNGHVEELKEFKNQNPDCKIFVTCFLPYEENANEKIDPVFQGYLGVVDYFFNSTLEHKRATDGFKEAGFQYLAIPFPAIVSFNDQTKNYKYDATFIGSFEPREDKRLAEVWYPEITKPGISSYLAGFNGKPMVDFNTMVNISRMTKINLNPHYQHQIYEKEDYVTRVDFNSRVFNLAAAGCFQLSNHPWYKKVFGEKYPVFDEHNFLDLFHYYMKNEDERLAIALDSQRITNDRYTSKIFAEKIVNQDFKFIADYEN